MKGGLGYSTIFHFWSKSSLLVMKANKSIYLFIYLSIYKPRRTESEFSFHVFLERVKWVRCIGRCSLYIVSTINCVYLYALISFFLGQWGDEQQYQAWIDMGRKDSQWQEPIFKVDAKEQFYRSWQHFLHYLARIIKWNCILSLMNFSRCQKVGHPVHKKVQNEHF